MVVTVDSVSSNWFLSAQAATHSFLETLIIQKGGEKLQDQSVSQKAFTILLQEQASAEYSKLPNLPEPCLKIGTAH